ncbi:unnamed protein product [Arctogadus glacialis]
MAADPILRNRAMGHSSRGRRLDMSKKVQIETRQGGKKGLLPFAEFRNPAGLLEQSSRLCYPCCGAPELQLWYSVCGAPGIYGTYPTRFHISMYRGECFFFTHVSSRQGTIIQKSSKNV